jgi:hypothetical protein
MAFRPSFVGSRKAISVLREFAAAVTMLPKCDADHGRTDALEIAKRRALRKRTECDRRDQQTLVASIKVLSDLSKMGWGIRVTKSTIQISRPVAPSTVDDDSRDYIRRQHHGQRDDQLRQPSVREFIRGLEARRPNGAQLVSIFSLMRDGAELADQLGDVNRRKGQEDRILAVAQVVRPYLQFVRGEDCCATTGLRLVDIWRYFRHTWANPYKSVPGRSMMILVRDAAAPFHPVIGIAALSSAAVAVTVRDEWIGWTAKAVLESIEANPSASYGRWLLRVVDDAINEIYKTDLLEDELLTPSGVKRPSAGLVSKLLAEAKHQRQKHYRLMQQRQYKKSLPPDGPSDDYWLEQAKLPLFRSKRADELARLLGVRIVLQRYFACRPTRQTVRQLIATGEGRDAIAKVLRKLKADRVGTAVADLTVCGAIPPYNELLGGKLVAMLMTSPEVVTEYRRRYGSAPSVIASSMAGRSVRRPADLVFIGTTSLYGQRPSQYDRITIPCSVSCGTTDDAVRYAYLGKTRGLGTFQFGEGTVRAFQDFLRQSKNGLQVNSVFGEGVNPRLRKIRDALGELGLPEDELLEHGTPRLVYGVQLARNMREYLLGFVKRPQYLLALQDPHGASAQIARWWAERWLAHRIERDDVLDRISRQTLVHPIRHGARVELPSNDFEQPSLFVHA